MTNAANDIADAIITGLSALGFPRCTIAKRKKPSLPPKKELAAGECAIVVCIGEEGPIIKATATKVLVKYPIAVVYIEPSGQLTGDNEQVHIRREAIRNVLQDYGIFRTISVFNDIDLSGGKPFDTSALSAALDYSVQTATVETLESRST